MESIYARLSDLIEGAEPVAVATIIEVKGSVPREVGAKMIIHPLGQHVGTVGGGCGEADVIKAALDVIQTGEPATVRVDLTEDISMQSLGVCGGIMDVFVERVAAGPTKEEGRRKREDSSSGLDPSVRIAALRQSMLAREPVALVTAVSGPATGRQAVVWLDKPPLGGLGLGDAEPQVIADAQGVLRSRQHRLLRYAGVGGRGAGVRGQASGVSRQSTVGSDPSSVVSAQPSAVGGRPSAVGGQPSVVGQPFSVFVEVQRRAPELLIVGAGHIAVPLAQLASLCDFSVTVLDDRPSFASPVRFPTARKVIAAPLRETVRDLSLDHDSYIVLVTRGHSHDVECLLEVLDRPVAYIGMIGSQRRVDAVFKLLEQEKGIDPVKFDRVYAPIGIAIGARTPAEIAVCIMAEIINVFRAGPALSISDRRRERDRRRRGEGPGVGG